MNSAISRRDKHRWQLTCNCTAYKFPHRLGGGRCTGSGFAAAEIAEFNPECGTCNLRSGVTCEVAEGQESLSVCPIIETFENL